MTQQFPFGTVSLELPFGYRTIDETSKDAPALQKLFGNFKSMEFSVGVTSSTTTRITIARSYRGAAYDMGTYEGPVGSTHLMRNDCSLRIISIDDWIISIALMPGLSA